MLFDDKNGPILRNSLGSIKYLFGRHSKQIILIYVILYFDNFETKNDRFYLIPFSSKLEIQDNCVINWLLNIML